MKVIHHVVQIAAAPTDVYESITTEAGLSGWWTTSASAGEPAVGSSIEFTFQEGFNPRMEITELEPNLLVAWICTGGHEPWAENRFRFELSDSEAKPDGTSLRFWQHYATELDDDAYGTYNFNWGYYLESLRLLCEEDSGKPFDP